MAAPTIAGPGVGIGQYLSQYYASKYGPSPGLDPEVEARLRQGYLKVLRDLQVARLSLQMEGMETWGQVQVMVGNMEATLISALAEAAKAKAMSDQALADLMGRNPILSEGGLQLLLGTGNPEVMENASAALDVMVVDSYRTAQGGGGRAAQRRAAEAATPQQEYEAHRQHILDELTPVIRTHASTISALPTDLEKAQTAMALGALVAETAEAKAIAEGMTPDQAAAIGQEARTFATGLMPVSSIEIARAEHEVVRSMYGEFQQAIADIGAGVPGGLSDRIVARANTIQAGIGATPEQFLANAQRLSGGPDDLELRVQAELDRLDAGDPLQEMLRQYASLPGFQPWMAAMNFRGPNPLLSAAIYASRAPHELRFAQQLVAQDPKLETDVARLEQLLREEGLRQDRGFATRPIERTVGFRVNPVSSTRVGQAVGAAAAATREAVGGPQLQTPEARATMAELEPTPLQRVEQAIKGVFQGKRQGFKPSIDMPALAPLERRLAMPEMPTLEKGGKTWTHGASGASFYEQPSGELVVLAGGTLQGIERGQRIGKDDPSRAAYLEGSFEERAGETVGQFTQRLRKEDESVPAKAGRLAARR